MATKFETCTRMAKSSFVRRSTSSTAMGLVPFERRTYLRSVVLTAQILAVLKEHIGHPMSPAEIADEIPQAETDQVEVRCYALRAKVLVGRNGAGSERTPFRFYLKGRH